MNGLIKVVLIAATIVIAFNLGTYYNHNAPGGNTVTTTTVKPVKTIEPKVMPEVSIESLKTGATSQTYRYIINGESDKIVFTTYKGIYDAVYSTNDVACYLLPGKTECTNEQSQYYYTSIINRKYQDTEISRLTDIIKSKSPDKDTQIKIAVSMVQNIPYSQVNRYVQDPYSVLYNNKGDCDDKTLLLVEILKNMNVSVVMLDYSKDNHMALGIKTTNYAYGYNYKEYTGPTAVSADDPKPSLYAYVETTKPSIITDKDFKFADGSKLSSTPDVIQMNTGDGAVTNLQNEYNDARLYRTVAGRDDLDKIEYNDYLRISFKYGL